MAACKSCEAPMIWATTERGNNMPLDEKPVNAPGPLGKPGVTPASLRGLWVVVNGKTRPATEEDRKLHRPMHTTHWSTCPNAEAHRR